jgi:hypothetical protein
MPALAALLGTIVEALIVIGLLAWTIHSFLKVVGGPNGSSGFDNYVFNFLNSTLGLAVKFLTSAESQLEPIVNAFRTAVNNQKGPLSSAIDSDIRGMIINAFNAVEKAVTLGKTSEPADAVKTGAAAMSEAFAFGIESFAVSAAFEACFPEKLNVLNGVGPMLSQLSGFDEVGKALREPLYRNAFARSAEYYYRSVFKPELPDEADAVTWNSRRLLQPGQLQKIFDNSGLKTEFETAFINSAYRAVQPRALATLFQDTDVPVAAMQAALQFAGIRDQEINLMLPAFVWNATKNVRAEYISALVRSAELGTVSMQELTQELTTLGYSAAASDLIQLTVATRKELQLAELYRKSITEAYRYGTITDAQYVPSLEAIGISAADAQAHYAVDSIAKQGKAAIAALKAEERLAAQRMRAAGQAAIAGYKSGTIDAAALEAALLLAGYDPAVAGFAVTVQTLKREGNEVFVYGVTLPRAAAVLLREQVSALGVQVKALLVTPAAALAALAGYGVPAANAQALVAEWAATHTPPADVGVLEPR